MLEKAREIAIKLASFQGVSYEHVPNSKRFKMISNTGVKWSARSYKLGNIHYKDDHLRLVLDYPCGEITESDVLKKLDLPQKKPRDRKTGFFIKRDPNNFDAVSISLYQDKLSDIDLNNGSLIDFAVEIFNKSSR